MKNKIKLISLIATIIVAILVLTIVVSKRSEKSVSNEGYEENINTEEEKTKETEVEDVEELKEQTGKTGAAELYEIQNGYGDVKVATIKSSIKYKVAFSGMIKGSKPEIEELDDIIEKEHPKNNGIWIYEKDRNTVLDYLKSVTLSQYSINQEGYLKIDNKEQQNDYDKKIEKAINGDKLYVLNVSSKYYIVDEITGEILDYSFEDMDEYQTYEYSEDNNKFIIFITENKKNQLNKETIIKSVIDIMG